LQRGHVFYAHHINLVNERYKQMVSNSPNPHFKTLSWQNFKPSKHQIQPNQYAGTSAESLARASNEHGQNLKKARVAQGKQKIVNTTLEKLGNNTLFPNAKKSLPGLVEEFMNFTTNSAAPRSQSEVTQANDAVQISAKKLQTKAQEYATRKKSNENPLTLAYKRLSQLFTSD
jgi:hypothetical protein